MSTVNVYNFLDGKNLCNIFANLIVTKINELFPDVKTEITVVNVRNFFVVRGITSCDSILNLSEIFQEFTNKYDEEMSKKIRVFDMISYNQSVVLLPLNISHKELKIESQRFNRIQKLINDYAKNKIYFNIKVDPKSNILYFDCDDMQYSEVKSILTKEFSEYNIIKHNFKDEIYVSDKIYGLSMHNEKPYLLLLNYITNHLFMLGVSKSLDISIVSDINTCDLENDNINLKINNDNHIVKTDWLESLVLDIFPFDIEVLKNKFYDCTDLTSLVIDVNHEDYSLSNLDLTNEIILL